MSASNVNSRAVLSGGEERESSPSGSSSSYPDYTRAEALDVKVVVIGDFGVGKSSLIRQLALRTFVPSSMATIGVEFTEYRGFPPLIDHDARVTQRVSCQLWDIAGQQYCSSMTRQYYRGSHAAIVVADVTRPETLDVANEWRRDFLDKTRGDSMGARKGPTRGVLDELPVFLICNKTDLPSKLNQEEVQQLAEDGGFARCSFVSAKSFDEVKRAFHEAVEYAVAVAQVSAESKEGGGVRASSAQVHLRRSMARGGGIQDTNSRPAQKKCCKE